MMEAAAESPHRDVATASTTSWSSATATQNACCAIPPYYNGRPNRSLRSQPPAGVRWLALGRATTSRELTVIPAVRGLHHRYGFAAGDPSLLRDRIGVLSRLAIYRPDVARSAVRAPSRNPGRAESRSDRNGAGARGDCLSTLDRIVETNDAASALLTRYVTGTAQVQVLPRALVDVRSSGLDDAFGGADSPSGGGEGVRRAGRAFGRRQGRARACSG